VSVDFRADLGGESDGVLDGEALTILREGNDVRVGRVVQEAVRTKLSVTGKGGEGGEKSVLVELHDE
jgi:hypothetical protein